MLKVLGDTCHGLIPEYSATYTVHGKHIFVCDIAPFLRNIFQYLLLTILRFKRLTQRLEG